MTIRNLEEAMSLEELEHFSSRKTSKELLKSMEGKLSLREKVLYDVKGKCVGN